MKIIADLHIHGRYSQATSDNLTIPNLEKWANVKGVGLLGTGDFTHPKWIAHLKEELTDDGNGIFKTKTGFPFLLQTEISLIYTQGGKGRRVHNLVLAPNLEVVQQITDYLLTKGRIDYDGRPIFKIPCPEFVESLRSISKDIEVIPAHVWTPWFGLLGSKSGFDSVEEGFQDKAKYIHALETGLSSDPAMNWRLSALDKYALVSFSDLHSFWPWRIGREATIFDIDLTYDNIIKALRLKKGLAGTIEVDPAYGKYHWDGHRLCNVCLKPSDTLKLRGVCPKCGKPLTIGVEYRVEQLADRPMGFKPKDALPYHSLIPLSEILAKVINKGIATKEVWLEYNKILGKKSELDIVLDTPFEELKKVTNERIAELIIKNREGKIQIQPGYDGEYGVPIFSDEDKKEVKTFQIKQRQTGLGDFA
jgi:uncharacterized protein (TIGR00375 family)